MAFRLPTHLGSHFIPSPETQTSPGSTTPHPSPMAYVSASSSGPATPWRGRFVVGGLRPSDAESNFEIKATAIEIEGNCGIPVSSHTTSWPSRLFFSVAQQVQAIRPSTPAPAHGRARSQSQAVRYLDLRTVEAWLHQQKQQPQQGVAMVNLMPDPLRDPNSNHANLQSFKNLATVLRDAQGAVVTTWTSAALPSALHTASLEGIVIFPSRTTTSILTGIVFVGRPFPEIFRSMSSSHAISPTGTAPSPPYHPSYTPNHVSSMNRPRTPGPSASTPMASAPYPRSQTPGPRSPTRGAYPHHSGYPTEQPQSPAISSRSRGHSRWASSSGQQYADPLAIPLTTPTSASGTRSYPAQPFISAHGVNAPIRGATRWTDDEGRVHESYSRSSLGSAYPYTP